MYMKAESQCVVRSATVDDFEQIVTLTTRRRRELAKWEDRYWCPSDGIDERHPLFLRWCIDASSGCVPIVVALGEQVVGCLFQHDRPDHLFLDDFCVVEGQWEVAGDLLLGTVSPTNKPAFICAPTKDLAQHDWLATTNFVRASIFWAISLVEWGRSDPDSRPSKVPFPNLVVRAPQHVFGPIDSATKGGLRVSTIDGYALGSASVIPAAYNPGGPTTVIDRVVGPDRGGVIDTVLEAAAQRGDAQAVFVSAHMDVELADLLGNRGATNPVTLWSKGSLSHT
jgi:hypothetical protein